MNDTVHYETAPEDRISFGQKLIYGLGAFINNLLAAAIGGMVIVLNLGLGMNPALMGWLGALPRLTDAITDPLMGYISDNTRSKWGRRRPYIFCGAIAAGLIFALLWQLPRGQSEMFYFWFFLAGSIIFYLAYTMFATPWVALGYELTPDYHERTRLMGVQNFIGQLAYVMSPWFLWLMQSDSPFKFGLVFQGDESESPIFWWIINLKDRLFEDMVEGAAGLAIAIGVLTIVIGILPAIFLKERFKEIAEAEATQKAKSAFSEFQGQMVEFFKGFATTLKFRPFLKLCTATFLVFNGFIMVASFQVYVIIYYVFSGDQKLGAEYAGWAGTLSAVSAFIVIMIVTYLATKIGKRRAFFVSTGISIVGYGMKWVCYNPDIPWLVVVPMPLIAFGLGGLFTLMPSMVADVCDLDELETHERREGMFGSIYWWVVKLGMALALVISGYLLNATGFDVALGGGQSENTIFLMRFFDVVIPMIFSGIAIWAVVVYKLTEEKAHQVREELERRRGSVAVGDA